VLGKQVPLGQVQIGSADPAASDLYANLPAKRNWHPAFQPLERSAVDRSGLMHDPRVHLAILTSRRSRMKSCGGRFLQRKATSDRCFSQLPAP